MPRLINHIIQIEKASIEENRKGTNFLEISLQHGLEVVLIRNVTVHEFALDRAALSVSCSARSGDSHRLLELSALSVSR